MQNTLNVSPSQCKNQCMVCLVTGQKLYSIADCQHGFCQNCCISYINTQSDNFSTAKCLQQGCNCPLDKEKQIYKKVPQNTKIKIQKHEIFLYVQKNPHLKICSNQDCNGYFSKTNETDLKCNRCDKMHCKNCFKLKHDGNCMIQDVSQLMGNLNYKKCPKCDVWIQKMMGCNYIDCKCGCKFCYLCGNQFDRDPCRNKNIWKNNVQMRKILRKIKIKKPQSSSEIVFFVPKLIIQIFLSVIVTILFSTISIAIALIMYVLFMIFGPLTLLFLLQEVYGYKKALAIASIIILYPLFSALFGLLLGLISIFYPCLRNTYHHGIYDPFDQGFSNVSLFYLSIIERIWSN